MISVQNLQRLLSGSNIIVVLFLGLMFSSCGGTDKAVNKSRQKPRTVKVKPTTETKPRKSPKQPKVDTVQWTEKTDPAKPPIVEVEEEKVALIKEDVYDLTYLLPLDASNYNAERKSSSDKFVQYFAGMEMAEQILEREGISLNITVVDSEKRTIEICLENGVSSQTDAIIGLHDSDDLRVAAKFAKRNKIPFVSPWKASTKITKDNPFYIQLRPNLDEYYKAMVKDIVENYPADQVYLLGRETTRDQKMAKYIQRLGKAYYRSEDLPFNYFEVEADSLIYGEVAFDSIFNPEVTNVVIIPHFSHSDEPFIYNTTRRLTVEKGPSEMVVYGMEIMIDSEKISFDQYSALNMKVARTKFVDERDSDVRRFKKKFYEIYGALPTADAYEGYDNLMFIGRNIYRYGKNFHLYLENDRGYYLQAAYDVQKSFKKGSESDKYSDINFLENKHVDIISFDGRQFHRSEK